MDWVRNKNFGYNKKIYIYNSDVTPALSVPNDVLICKTIETFANSFFKKS